MTKVTRAPWFVPLVFLALAQGLAQKPVAPTPDPAVEGEGEDFRGYNVVNSWEFGYRAHTVGGNSGKYRSDVNFSNGLRLLSSHLGVYSKDGKGRFFDELVLTTQGLGNDPYQFASLRVRKNRVFEYSLTWRLNTYFNPALTISSGRHALDTSRRWQDHDFIFRPETRFKGILGYSRNRQDGPGLSTLNVFGRSGDEFPTLLDIRRERNEYRLGGEIDLRRFRLRIVRIWENFKEDTPERLPGPSAGNNPENGVTLDSFERIQPYHGNSPGWRGQVYAEPNSRLSISARGTYTGGDRNFIVDETAAGANRLGGVFNRQVLVFGTGRRPVGTGNATINFFPTPHLTISNHTAFYNVRMEGDSFFRQFDNQTLSFEQLAFQSLGIRTIVNTTDVNFRFRPWIGFYGGYHYSTRRIRSRELTEFGDFKDLVTAEQDNTLNAGLAGIRVQPVKPLTINLEGEVGRADNPFFPVGERNFHTLGGRLQYRTSTLLVSAATRIRYNTNAVTLSAHSSRSRNYTFDFSWTPNARFAVDAGYQKIHLDTLSGIRYFVGFEPVEGERSIFISNIHAVNAGLRVALTSRLELYAGYNRVQDTGDGRSNPSNPPPGSPDGSALAAFRAAQTFPLTYQSPLARLSLKLHPRLKWNFGYQFYHYKEDFLVLQNYRAHTGYTSVVWSF